MFVYFPKFSPPKALGSNFFLIALLLTYLGTTSLASAQSMTAHEIAVVCGGVQSVVASGNEATISTEEGRTFRIVGAEGNASVYVGGVKIADIDSFTQKDYNQCLLDMTLATRDAPRVDTPPPNLEENHDRDSGMIIFENKGGVATNLSTVAYSSLTIFGTSDIENGKPIAGCQRFRAKEITHKGPLFGYWYTQEKDQNSPTAFFALNWANTVGGMVSKAMIKRGVKRRCYGAFSFVSAKISFQDESGSSFEKYIDITLDLGQTPPLILVNRGGFMSPKDSFKQKQARFERSPIETETGNITPAFLELTTRNM